MDRYLVGPQETLVLAETHPDPFVQSAIRTVYLDAPGLLDPDLVSRINKARLADREEPTPCV